MAGRIVLGIILLLLGLFLLREWLPDFLSLLKGSIPILLVFIGFVLIWIETEEMSMSKAQKKRH